MLSRIALQRIAMRSDQEFTPTPEEESSEDSWQVSEDKEAARQAKVCHPLKRKAHYKTCHSMEEQ